MRRASAEPESPVETWWEVAVSLAPPEEPETTTLTPARISEEASVHQKHPPARMIVWSALSLGLGRSIRGLGRSAEEAWAGRSQARPKRLVSAMIMTPGKRRLGLRFTVLFSKGSLVGCGGL